MFRTNDGEDKYSPSDPRYADAEKEKKQKDQDRQDEKVRNRKHIKITSSMLENIEDEGDEYDEENEPDKFDMDRELHAQTGPAGNLGALTSLATQARGPGFAYGHPIQMSELIEIPFQLLKTFSEDSADVAMMRPLDLRGKNTKEEERGRAKEERKKWRPSTGTFKKPPGGMMGGVGATMRSYKAKRRGVRRGTKTGMMDAPLSVEMEHRGVAVKQPKSKDPAAYREYLGQQDAMKRQGNVRVTPSTPQKLAPRRYEAGKTGGGRLQSLLPTERGSGRTRGMPKPKLKPHRAPPIVPPTISGMPRLNMGGSTNPFSGSMASQSMAKSLIAGSDLQKKYSWGEQQEMRLLMQKVKRLLEEKESKKKGKGDKDTSGGGSNLPKHPANGPKQTNRNEGGTEDPTNDPRHFGADPVGVYTSRGGRTA
tara:strand:- start:1047 stop:2315 length:1269 start_codon:yes stop_codon:yes gene_type:complete